jgi:hypothetical protein
MPWLGLALSLRLVMSAWSLLRQPQEHRFRDRFLAEAVLLQDRIANRVATHEQLKKLDDLASLQDVCRMDRWS